MREPGFERGVVDALRARTSDPHVRCHSVLVGCLRGVGTGQVHEGVRWTIPDGRCGDSELSAQPGKAKAENVFFITFHIECFHVVLIHAFEATVSPTTGLVVPQARDVPVFRKNALWRLVSPTSMEVPARFFQAVAPSHKMLEGSVRFPAK